MLCFDYDHELPTLQRLITLTNRASWVPEDIDFERPLSVRGGEYEPILEWHGLYRNEYIQSLTPQKREQLARQMVACEFSQILHGEQAALMLAGQLTYSVSDLDARIFAANQARDEARHVQAVKTLLHRLGPIYPIGDKLQDTLEDLLVCTVWPKQVLGLQLFLEARALLSFRQTLMFVRDPVFRDVTTRIERDEAHHVAFGIQYLRTGIDELSADEKNDLVAYAKHLNEHIWILTKQDEFRAAFSEVDLDFDECFAAQAASFSTPNISLAVRDTVEGMHAQFEKWFANAVRRVGLDQAVPVPEPVPAEPEASPETLPWIPQGT